MDEPVWQKWYAWYPVKTNTGWRLSYYVWRRKSGSVWEYQSIPETEQEWWDRQW